MSNRLRTRLGCEQLDRRDVPAVLYQGTSLLTSPGGDLSVTTTVRDDAPGFEGLYHWEYAVTNLSYEASDFYFYEAGDYQGTLTLLSAAASSAASSVTSSLSDFWEGRTYPGAVEWSYYGGVVDAFFLQGQTAVFSFVTTPRLIVDTQATYLDSGVLQERQFAPDSTAVGTVKGPGSEIPAATLDSYDYAWENVDPTQSIQSLPLTQLQFTYNGVAYTLADVQPGTSAVANYANGVFTGATFSLTAKGGNRPLTVTLAEHAVAGGTEWKLTGMDDTPAPNNIGQLFQAAADVKPLASFNFSSVVIPEGAVTYQLTVKVYKGINTVSSQITVTVTSQSTVTEIRNAVRNQLNADGVMTEVEGNNWLTVHSTANSLVDRIDINLTKPVGSEAYGVPRFHRLVGGIIVKYDGVTKLPSN